jgi:hypothetical protein
VRTIATDPETGLVARPTRWATDADAVRVRLEYALRTALGEWALDRAFGLNRAQVLGDDLSPLPAELEVGRVAAGVLGVARVELVRFSKPQSRAEAVELGIEAQWDAQPGRVALCEVVCVVRGSQSTVSASVPLGA